MKSYTKIISDARKSNFFKVLTQHRFIIPKYQRFYDWDKELVKELLDDINDGIRSKENLFLGICVFKGKEDETKLEIIDGQQRIIAFLIILRSLIESKLGKNTEGFKEILKNSPIISRNKPRIKLNTKSPDSFFKEFILDGNKDSKKIFDKRILPIKRIIQTKKIVDAEIEKYKINTLSNLSDFIKNNIEIVFMLTEDELQAFDIFESINSKKIDLTIADLTKNLLFRKCKKVDEITYNKANEKWDEIIERFENSTSIVSSFLKTYWASKYEIARGKKFYKEYKKSDLFNETKNPLKLIDDINEYSIIYSELVEPTEEYWGTKEVGKNIIHTLRNLNYLGIKTAYPLLIQLKRHFKDKEIYTTFKSIENLSFLSTVLFGERPGILETLYSKKASELFSNKGKKREHKKLQIKIRTLMKEYFERNKFETRVKEISLSNKIAKYILLRILKEKIGTKIPRIGFKEATLEHILPKDYVKWIKVIEFEIRENPDYFEEYGDTTKDKIETYHKKYCYILGNLSLLTQIDNTKTGNRLFEDKKKIYTEKERRNYLFKNVISENKWSHAEIDERTKKLTEDLKETILNN